MASEGVSHFTILMAEDDPDDRFLIAEVFRELEIQAELRFVEDGEELMHYLRRSGKYADTALFPLPSLILLDLNMPRMDGREALVEIKAHPDLRKIPVVVLTTSQERRDEIHCRKAGAEVFVTKASAYSELAESIRNLITRYFS